MKIEEVKEAANWCLNCKTKPCSTKGCPMRTNIPEFINEIKSENYEEAYKILQTNNVFSYVCGLVCPQEEQCEGNCVRAVKQTATKIGELEKFVNSWAKENNIKSKIDCKKSNGKKVAIVGAGPAGLECAVELLKEGFKVTIFEKDELSGGILTYGIPDFRLSKDIVKNIVDEISRMGAEFKNGVELGKDITVEELQKEYDAVFVGIGATKPSMYSVSDKNLDSVYDSDTFLRAYSNKNFIPNLGKVAIIGGGNVAMDSARAAIRMGAEEVKILYRRDKAHMPARTVELEEAIEDGVVFKPLIRVISANVEEKAFEEISKENSENENIQKNNLTKHVNEEKDKSASNFKMVSLNCIKTEIVDGKAQDVQNTEFIEEANTLVFAIGLKPNKAVLEAQGIELDEWGMVKVNENGKTNLDKVYSGGDTTESKSTVCRALAAGKRAALGIIKELG
jgi:glutamate synthase (NADPH/NADH) small chain